MPAENLAIWRTEQHAAQDELETLTAALDHMNADLARMGAGDTQRRLAVQWPPLVEALAAEGEQIIKDHNPRLTRVSEAQAQAGGQREVAANKRYSQR